MSDDNNVTDLPQGKKPKSFSELMAQTNGEIAEKKTKEVKAKVLEILAKRAEAEKLIRGYDEELKQLAAKYEQGLL